ncbi:MAG: UDP-N-acetylmuramoyl-L-alanyl-D-glutamate--2,6-diaminopimelate ligase, partial [Candidatus Cloacimonetes bacterium]|nr:UDP-N-acetylmuramoyl-L-alanyl-D-glutamate--2,6-diaminopimelate ligase [Candidatus Cloacimonadota bacterium]
MCGKSKMITLVQIRSCLEKDDNFISMTSADVDLICKDIQTDSRKVGQNSLFVCIRGYEYDGHDFAASVVASGASILIVEQYQDIDAIQILVKSSRKAAAVLISLHLGNPAARLKLIGITGTNGKTSICQIGEQLFRKLGVKTGTIGTLGYSINGVNFPTERTTPDIIDLHKIFARMADAGIEYVLMEVSSHSIYLDRIHGLEFKIAVFTNLTQDHLDFHHTLE